MRLFISIEIPKDLHRYCKQLQNLFPDLKKTDEFHITIQFLGDNIDSAGRITDTLDSVIFSPLEIEMGNVMPFGHPNNPKGIWIKCKNNDQLNKLSEDIKNLMKPLGFISDFPFSPHITLGRYKNKPTDRPKTIKGEAHKFCVDTFYLMESILTPSGPIYKKIKSFSV